MQISTPSTSFSNLLTLCALALTLSTEVYSAAPRFRIWPSELLSRDSVDVVFSLCAGDNALESGAELNIELPYAALHPTDSEMWDAAQITSPDSTGYVSVETPVDVVAEAIGDKWLLGARISQGVLQPGDSIAVHYSGKVQSAATHLRPRVRWRRGPTHPFVSLRTDTGVTIKSRPAATIRAWAPTDIAVGESFALRLALLDDRGNLDTDYDGLISIQALGNPAELWTAAITPADSGRIVIEDLLLLDPGMRHLEVTTDTIEPTLVPVRVHEDAPQTQRFFGDSHFHTGSGSSNPGWRSTHGGDHRGNYSRAQLAYRYVRDVSLLDWASASEHEIGMEPTTWDASQDIADAYNDLARFTTFYAYEWNSPYAAHRLVLHRERGTPLFHGKDPATDSFAELADAVREVNQAALIIPHIHKADPINPVWQLPANDLQRVGEIYSTQNSKPVWGGDDPTIFELGLEDPWSYRYGWAQGHIIGVIGSTDDHFGLPGRNSTESWFRGSGGPAAVLAAENSREALFGALHPRNSYATTGTRIFLDFTVNEEPMGSVLELNGDDIQLSVVVGGTAPLSRVEIVHGRRSGFETTAFDAAGELSFDFTGQDQFDGEASLYQIRVIQEDDEMAWSSPIWVHQGQ